MQQTFQKEFALDWLIFLTQLPTHPSSLRVAVWRHMRAAGALGLQNSAWILPHTSQNENFLVGQMESIQHQGAGAQVFTVAPLTSEVEKDLLARFQAERGEEYSEFAEGCQDCLAELEKETRQEKFTFAEMEEIEEDLEKLKAWLVKIQKRDFIGGEQAEEAKRLMEACRQRFEQFTQKVYEREELDTR
jgi:hypothetical protein